MRRNSTNALATRISCCADIASVSFSGGRKRRITDRLAVREFQKTCKCLCEASRSSFEAGLGKSKIDAVAGR